MSLDTLTGALACMSFWNLSRNLLTPLIAVITIYIAWQQYRINKLNLRGHLLTQRFEIYHGTMKFIANIMQNSTPSSDDLIQLLRNTRESEFLFGKEVVSFIDSLYKRGNELHAISESLKSCNLGSEQRQKLLDSESVHFDWFKGQFDTAKKVFAKYLTIHK